MGFELDALAPSFRRATDHWPEAPILGSHYDSLVAACRNDHCELVDLVKSFVESVCWTILKDHDETLQQATPGLVDIVGATFRLLGLNNTRGADSFDKVLSSYNKLSSALNEVRNDCGSVAHGRDGFLDALNEDLLIAFLMVGNSILGIIFAALDGLEPDLIHTREPYERFKFFNELIDKSVALEAEIDDADGYSVLVATIRSPSSEDLELRLEPSRVLYENDRQAYREVLQSINQTPAADSRVAGKVEGSMIDGVGNVGTSEKDSPKDVRKSG